MHSPISQNNILPDVSITSFCNSELCLATHLFLLFLSQHLSNDCLHCGPCCVWISCRQVSLMFQQANTGTALKGAVTPQNPTWACLPSVQVFLGMFVFHLESLLKRTLRKCSTHLGWLVGFAGQMIILGCCSSGDTRHALSHKSKISDCCVLWLEALLLHGLTYAASPAPCNCTGSRICWLNSLNILFSCGLHMHQKLSASCAHQIYYSCSEKMLGRSGSYGRAVSCVCLHFTVNRILYFSKMMWSWTNIEDRMFLTEIQPQFTGQTGQLLLFWEQTQSWEGAFQVQAARGCCSRQWACSTARAHRAPEGSCMPACSREPTRRPKRPSAKVVAMEEATESRWTGDQSWREGLVLWKYAELEEGFFFFKHLILICFTQQTEMFSFLKDFIFCSRDWNPLWWPWYTNLTGKVRQFSPEFCPWTLVWETQYMCINTCMY